MKDLKHTLSYHKGYPDPQKFREEYELLNGDWKFVFDEDGTGLFKHFEREFPAECLRIRAPYPYQCEKSGIGLPEKQCDTVWYEREFDLSELDRVHRIIFHGVDYQTTVFVNGRYALTHEGGYDMFTVDVPPYAVVGKNKITLRVVDTMAIDQVRGKQRWRKDSFSCFYTETSGIVRDVYMEHLNRLHIEDFTLRADYASGTLRVDFTAPKGTELTVSLSDADGKPVAEQTFSAEDGVAALAIKNARGWSCDDPYLYNVELTLKENGKTVDRVLSYCGFITIEARGGRFFLNGKDTYLKFVLDQGYWVDTITTPTEEEIVGDIELTLACGFNGSRMHERVPAPLNFYYMDLYGLYAWQECPSANAYSYAVYKQYFKQFSRMIRDHFSHPCILAYVLFNESWGVNEISESAEEQKLTVDMYNLVKRQAGGRLVISNDGWEHTVSDILTFHNYIESYEELHAFLGGSLDGVVAGENRSAWSITKSFSSAITATKGSRLSFRSSPELRLKRMRKAAGGTARACAPKRIS